MAYSTTVKTRRDGRIRLKDGTTPAAVTLLLSYEGDGNLTFTNEVADRVPIYDRGVIVGLRKGNDATQSGSFTVNMRQFTSATDAGSVIDFITKSGHYSGNVSSGGSAYAFYTVDVEVDIEGTDHGDGNDHVALLSNCLCTYDFSEGDTNTFNINFEVFGGITMT